MESNEPRPILLVGSVALPSAAAVFEQAGTRLDELAAALPDGETGERLKWVGFFTDKLAEVKGLELAQEIEFGGEVPQKLRFYKTCEGTRLSEVTLGSPGYAEIALKSYHTFLAARNAGFVSKNTRFQVSLPTPLVLSAFIQAPVDERLAFIEQTIFAELEEILATIPHGDLAIQWDLALETESEEARRHPERAPPYLIPDWPYQVMIDAAARLVDAVPVDVRVGLHLCYGNADGTHIIDPADSSVMRDIANAISFAADRPINWIHMPVPASREDDAYFAPLDSLAIASETQLYLGVVHESDGVEGATKRLDAAERHLGRRVGIATECGMGRRRPDQIPALLDLHRAIAERS